MSFQAQHVQPNNRSITNTNEAQLSFVACHLRQPPEDQTTNRRDGNHSWGLWVSLQGDDKTALVVANIQKHSFDQLLQWSRTTTSQLDGSIVWNQSYGSYGNDVWKSYFSLSPSVGDGSSNTLLPGDVIVAINGLPISSFGGSIENVRNYLRQSNELFLVAARSHTLALQQKHLSSQEQVRVQEVLLYVLCDLLVSPDLLTFPPRLSDTPFFAKNIHCHWPLILHACTSTTCDPGIQWVSAP